MYTSSGCCPACGKNPFGEDEVWSCTNCGRLSKVCPWCHGNGKFYPSEERRGIVFPTGKAPPYRPPRDCTQCLSRPDLGLQNNSGPCGRILL